MKEEFISLPLQLEVPQNDGEFRLGLMFRESLEQDRGMLFIFENTDQHSFHMKNTFIPLDIAFINEEGIIESIKELDPMNPIPVYPDGEIRYAIEVNRGWFAENSIEVGDIILEDTEETEIDLTEVKDKKGKGSGTKDACYHKVKSRYSVWPSAYASGALVKCRKVGAANWGNKSEEYIPEEQGGKDSMRAQTTKIKPKPEPAKMDRKEQGQSNVQSDQGEKEKTADDYEKSMTDRNFKNLKKTIEKGGTTQDQQNQYALELSRRSTNTGSGTFSVNYNTDQRNSRGKILGHNKGIKDHYDWRSTLDEKCWAGYEKKGMKTMFGKRYPNCVKKSKKKK